MVHILYYEKANKKWSFLENLKEWLEKILKDFKRERFDVNVVFCDNTLIRALNKQYRGIDSPTDVLSFSMIENIDDKNEIDTIDDNNPVLGDVIISLDRAREQAEEFGVPEEEETVRLAIHGLLHLLGFDHEKSREEEKKMFKKQDAYIEGFLKRYSH